jgi:hypothetical protein
MYYAVLVKPVTSYLIDSATEVAHQKNFLRCKVKGYKVHHRTGYKNPKGLDGVRDVTLQTLYPVKDPVTIV